MHDAKVLLSLIQFRKCSYSRNYFIIKSFLHWPYESLPFLYLPSSVHFLLFLSPFIIMPILHTFSPMVWFLWMRDVTQKSVPIRILFFWMIVHNWLFLLSIPLGFSLLSPLAFLYILNNFHRDNFRINCFPLFLLKMPSYKTDWPWKSWNPVIRNHTFGNSSIYYIHTLSETDFIITYLFPCSCEFYGISGKTIHGIQRHTFENSLFYF